MSKGTIPVLPEGYADWLTQLRQRAALPNTLGHNLPSIAEIEAELAGELNTGSAVE